MNRTKYEQSGEVDQWLSTQGRDRYEITSSSTMPRAIRAALTLGRTLDERRALYDVFSQLYGPAHPGGANPSPGPAQSSRGPSSRNLSGPSQTPSASPRANTSSRNLSAFSQAPQTVLDHILGQVPESPELEPGMTNAFPNMESLDKSHPELARFLSKAALAFGMMTTPIVGKSLYKIVKKSPYYSSIFDAPLSVDNTFGEIDAYFSDVPETDYPDMGY